MSELFRDEWLEMNADYGFDVTLSGTKIKHMFDAAAKKYCQIMEPGILDENCEVIGKITAKATLWDKKSVQTLH